MQINFPLEPGTLVNSQLHRGMMWFVSLVHAASDGSSREFVTSAGRSIEYYSVFVETGDRRFLGMAEDFLKDSLEDGPLTALP